MWQRLLLMLLLLAASGASRGFLFPEEGTPAEAVTEDSRTGSHDDDDASVFEGNEHVIESSTTEDYVYSDYDENSVDVGDFDDESGGLETRFFFSKRTSASIGRKLSKAASSLLNTIHGGPDRPPPPTPPTPPPPIIRPPVYPAGGDPYRAGPHYPLGPYPPNPDTVDYEGPPLGRHPHGFPSTHASAADRRGVSASIGYGPEGAGISTDNGAPDFGGGDQGHPSADYSDSDDEMVPETRMHFKFPVDRSGRITCGRVPRRKKKACRRARRKQNRSPGRGQTWGPVGRPGVGSVSRVSTAAPISCPTVPDAEAMSKAEEQCCYMQQRGDLHGFNKCCETLGFCPICKVDSEKLAQEECCEILHGGDTLGYRQCCSRYGVCPKCGPPPTPSPEPEPAGCTYKNKRFPVGERMDSIPSKCLIVRCENSEAGPQTTLQYIDEVGCCVLEGQGQPYYPGSEVSRDECTNMVCKNGKWLPKPTKLAAVFASPCPDDWLDMGGSCVHIWKELMTFKNATKACAKLSATLASPQNSAQLTQLINAFKNMEDRDPKLELGGWMNARFRNHWQTLQGDTLTFAPWEENYPDDRLRTSCAGLTVTDKSQGWKDYMCDHRSNMMFPVCQVEKPQCGEIRGGCGPYNGDELLPPGSELTMLSTNPCERFVCNKDSYVIRETNKHCCYHKEWNAKDFGKKRGWYTGLFPPGSFQLYDGMRCECNNGVSECNRFFD